MAAWDASGTEAAAVLPADLSSASVASRPQRSMGSEPGAVVLLLEFDVQPAEAA